MFESHEFYCIQCGNRGIPIPRKKGSQRKPHHRKKLFCIHCGKETNHIECRNEVEVEDFKIKFANGDFKEEAEESESYLEKENEKWTKF